MDFKRKLTIYNYLMQKKLKKRMKKFGHKEIIKMKAENEYDSHIVDDMPLTISRDPRPGHLYEQEAR